MAHVFPVELNQVEEERFHHGLCVSVCCVCVFNIHSANIYYRCLFCGEYYASVGAWEKEKNQRSTLLGSFSYPPVEELCRQALVMLDTSCVWSCVCPCSFLCSSVHVLDEILTWFSPKPPFEPVLISFLWLRQNTLAKNNAGGESDVWFLIPKHSPSLRGVRVRTQDRNLTAGQLAISYSHTSDKGTYFSKRHIRNHGWWCLGAC